MINYRYIAPFAWPNQNSFIATYWKEAFKIGKAIILAAVVKTSHALVWTALEVKCCQKISLHERVDVRLC